jgi:hypothetical protein
MQSDSKHGQWLHSDLLIAEDNGLGQCGDVVATVALPSDPELVVGMVWVTLQEPKQEVVRVIGCACVTCAGEKPTGTPSYFWAHPAFKFTLQSPPASYPRRCNPKDHR